MAIEIGKWLINDKEDSLNYGRHYCSICGDYASAYDERNPIFEDNIAEICPNCGAYLPTAELRRRVEVTVKEYSDRQLDLEKFKSTFVINTKLYGE